MASSYWAIFSFLFIFGLVIQTFNEMNVFGVQQPEIGLKSITNDTAQSMHAGAESQSLNLFTAGAVLWSMIKIIVTAAMMGCGIILPFLLLWGFPFYIALLLQTVVAFFAIPWVFELWTGRPLEW